MLYPNYKQQGDPGEKTFRSIAISNIQVNGERQGDIKQKVIVHDGRFSPELPVLAHVLQSNQPLVVSATFNMPKTDLNHLYHGITQVEMLNIIPSSKVLGTVSDQTTLDDFANLFDPGSFNQIQDFIREGML